MHEPLVDLPLMKMMTNSDPVSDENPPCAGFLLPVAPVVQGVRLVLFFKKLENEASLKTCGVNKYGQYAV